jgi:hypothetical protein
MWFLFRMVVGLITALLRFYWRHCTVEAMGPWNGALLFRRRSSRTTETLGFAFESPLIFELHPETRSDRIMKKLGLVIEQQSGDPAFDEMVFVRSDHPALGGLFRADAEARAACLTLLVQGVRRISADGTRLWIEIPRVAVGSTELLSPLHTLRERLVALLPTKLERTKDSLLWRASLVEALVWGLAAYAFTGLLTVLQLGDVPQAADRIIGLSAFISLGLGALSFASIFILLRRSSRTKFILWESSLVLTFAVPVASGSLVMDLNQVFDQNPSRVTYYRIVERQALPYTKEGRRGAVTVIDYVIRIEPTNPDDPRIPRYLPVSHQVYKSPEETLMVELGNGWFDIPWIKSIDAAPPAVRDRTGF